MKRIEPYHRFGAVAAAIGVKEQTLRNWLFRHNDLDLFSERPPGGWRSFSEKDVWVLAVAAELIRHSAPPNEAVDAARQGLGLMDHITWEGRPDYLWCGIDRWEKWGAWDDEGLAAELTGGATLIRITIPTLFGQVRRRLHSIEGEPSDWRDAGPAPQRKGAEA